MFAVRRKDGNSKPFRVGARAYYGAHWLLEQALTPEHEFAATHGALAIVEIESLDDRRLMPFPVEQADFTERATAIDPDALQQMVTERDARIVQLESQVLELEGRTQGHEAEIAALRAALEEVRTSVETFPAASEATRLPSAPPGFPAIGSAVGAVGQG